MNEEERINELKKPFRTGFKDLSTALKILVVFGWVSLAADVLLFIIGFVLGFIGY